MKAKFDKFGSPEQVYVNGSVVCEFPLPLVMKPFVPLTVRLNVPLCPCFTLNEPDDPRLELRVKLSVVAVTVKLTVVVAEADPEVPVTVTLVDSPPAVRGREIVTVVVSLPALMLVGLKLHETPLTDSRL